MMRCANIVGETLSKNNKPKLIIHETDCHGEGVATYNGYSRYYCYDGDGTDIKQAINFLVDIGFINPEEVVIFEGDDIYDVVEKAVNNNGNT